MPDRNAGVRPVHMDGTSSAISVVVVDDHPAVREAVGITIDGEDDLELQGKVGSMQEALPLIFDRCPHVAVIDITLGEHNGLDLVRQICKQCPGVGIVVFSMHDEKLYGGRAMKAGAHGYVMKSAPTTKLLEAIRHVAQGDRYFSPEVKRRYLNRFS